MLPKQQVVQLLSSRYENQPIKIIVKTKKKTKIVKPINSLNEQIKKYVKVGEQIHKNTNTTTRGGQLHLQNELQTTLLKF